MAIGRSWILCMPNMPDCGGLRIGEDISEPYTPPLEIVKVPPCISAMDNLPSRARAPFSAIAFSISANDKESASRITGTTNPVGVPAAMPIWTKFLYTISVPSISELTSGTSRSAWQQATVKKDIKPNFTPCFFKNKSLYSLRRAMTSVMSTSL